jgi:hypothetical protein
MDRLADKVRHDLDELAAVAHDAEQRISPSGTLGDCGGRTARTAFLILRIGREGCSISPDAELDWLVLLPGSVEGSEGHQGALQAHRSQEADEVAGLVVLGTDFKVVQEAPAVSDGTAEADPAAVGAVGSAGGLAVHRHCRLTGRMPAPLRAGGLAGMSHLVHLDVGDLHDRWHAHVYQQCDSAC